MRPTRFHVAVGVASIEASRDFYTRLFGCEPTKVAFDQVDWILDDPAVNFSIFFNVDRDIGPEHFGLDLPAEKVDAWQARIDIPEDDIWTPDPDGIRVEVFSTDPPR